MLIWSQASSEYINIAVSERREEGDWRLSCPGPHQVWGEAEWSGPVVRWLSLSLSLSLCWRILLLASPHFPSPYLQPLFCNISIFRYFPFYQPAATNTFSPHLISSLLPSLVSSELQPGPSATLQAQPQQPLVVLGRCRQWEVFDPDVCVRYNDCEIACPGGLYYNSIKTVPV